MMVLNKLRRVRPADRMFRWSLLMLAVYVANGDLTPVRADGPKDNLPDQVRPIPPIGREISAQTISSLRSRCRAVRNQWDELIQSSKAPAGKQLPAGQMASRANLESLTPEVLVFPRAVELAIEFGQFYKPNEVERAEGLLQEANRRIEMARTGGSWQDVVGLDDGADQQLIVGGYRSKIDGSYQPYGLVVPAGFGKADSRPRRLDLWFHGRGETLSEVAFLSNQRLSAGQYTPADTFVLHPYGRYSNAFKFAGEIDVLEVLDYIQSRLPVDPDRVSVRGFSMGGAACWQFATHYADRWFAANPGAGFSETPEFLTFFQDEKVRETTPDYQQTLWQLYDCPVWSRNLLHCPTVAYSGEIDRQKQAADVMVESLAKHGVDLVHVIGPDTAHKIHPASKVEIEARMADLARRTSSATPGRIDFTTVTLRYHKMHWLEIHGLGQHWKPARVQAQYAGNNKLDVRTENVTHLLFQFETGQWLGSMGGAVAIDIDGQELVGPTVRSDRSWTAELHLDEGGWKIGPPDQGLSKRPGLQGPIDDALMDSFLFVMPSGKSDDPVVQKWVEAESAHAMLHWRKHFRGDIQMVVDTELTDEQIANNHLVLFGDPQSNQYLARIQSELPLTWNENEIKLGDQSVPRAGHVPILIYPNPAQPNHYVVINSGFTFREYDYLNNARQTPKLPDWALVNVHQGATSQFPGVIRATGFFDESWQP